VPKLAAEVINLKELLDTEIQTVSERSQMLENPDDHPRRIDLGGEDPDSQALDAKI
jgi:hypothetical protein